MRYRIYSRRRDTDLVVSAQTRKEAKAKAKELFSAVMLGPGPWHARPFRERGTDEVPMVR